MSLRLGPGGRHSPQGQQSFDVVGQLPDPQSDRAVATTPQQDHHNGSPKGEHLYSDPGGVAMRVFTQLSMTGTTLLVLNAPALHDAAQQSFWRGTDAGEEPVPRRCALPLLGRRLGDPLNDPRAARPVGLDVLRCLLGVELPVHVAPVEFFAITCSERDLALSLELAADLALEGLLVGLNGQEHIGPLGEAPLKNG